MLILVGVTVTVAVNGGLFEKTKEGAKGTTIDRSKRTNNSRHSNKNCGQRRRKNN